MAEFDKLFPQAQLSQRELQELWLDSIETEDYGRAEQIALQSQLLRNSSLVLPEN
jgi:hypothetical protein